MCGATLASRLGRAWAVEHLECAQRQLLWGRWDAQMCRSGAEVQAVRKTVKSGRQTCNRVFGWCSVLLQVCGWVCMSLEQKRFCLWGPHGLAVDYTQQV